MPFQNELQTNYFNVNHIRSQSTGRFKVFSNESKVKNTHETFFIKEADTTQYALSCRQGEGNIQTTLSQYRIENDEEQE